MAKFISILLLFYMPIFANGDFEKAVKLFEKGQFSLARPIFEVCLKQNPNNIRTIEYLGDIECNSLSWENASIYYRKLTVLKPTEANYFYKYGGALGMFAKECNKFRALGMIGEVRESFEKAIALNPKHIEARWALIELYLQLPAIIGGSEKKASQYADELSKLSAVDGYLAKGHIAEYFDRFAKAEFYYKKAVEIGRSKTAYQKLADLYKNKMKQPAKAKSVLEEYGKLPKK